MTILFNSNEMSDIVQIIFPLENQWKCAKLLIEYIKSHNYISKAQISKLADLLNEGNLKELGEEFYDLNSKLDFELEVLKYNRKQFYSRIVGPMKEMGLINLGLYDKKYRLSLEFLDNLEKLKELWSQIIKKQ